MKRVCSVIGLIVAVVGWLGVGHGADGEAILGNWLTEEGTAEVEIYKCGDDFCVK